MAEYAARAIGCDKKRVLVASTGVIGRPLPIERIVQATPRLHAAARGDGLDDFVRAIMTTDRFEKRALRLVPLGPKTKARVVGVAKGAGMIAPNMATTLGVPHHRRGGRRKTFLRTVLREEVDVDLQRHLRRRRHVDERHGRRSWRRARPRTNRSIEGRRRQGQGVPPGGARRSSTSCRARSCATAKAPRTSSPSRSPAPRTRPLPTRWRAASPPRRLCKTAIFGADPNWGRILAAIGNAGVDIDPRKLDVAIGEVEICRGGVGVGSEAERRAHEVMRRGEYTIRVHLNRGRAQGRHVTCDLTVDYVKLNADYRT